MRRVCVWPRPTPVENSHGVVVSLNGKLLFGVFLDFGDDGVIGWPDDVVE